MSQKLEVVYRPIDMLNEYDQNSRKHSKHQIIQLQNSLREFGFTNPILLDPEGTVIAGHARLEAATRNGLEKVPTITLEGLSEDQLMAYVIADNKLAMNASWDNDILKSEIEKLGELDFNIDLLGFTGLEIADILDLEIDNVEMPSIEDDDEEKKVYRTIKVQFECENDVQTFAELLGRKIKGDLKAFWFPIENNPADFDSDAFEIPEEE